MHFCAGVSTSQVNQSSVTMCYACCAVQVLCQGRPTANTVWYHCLCCNSIYCQGSVFYAYAWLRLSQHNPLHCCSSRRYHCSMAVQFQAVVHHHSPVNVQYAVLCRCQVRSGLSQTHSTATVLLQQHTSPKQYVLCLRSSGSQHHFIAYQ